MKAGAVTSGLFWKSFERILSQLISISVSIVLARLVSVEDYGLLAIVTLFVNILTLVLTSGVSDALVHKYDSDELDFSSMFWFNIGLGVCLYIFIFLLAPYISIFFDEPKLTLIIRVLSVVLLLNSYSLVACAYIVKRMMFKLYFWSTLVGKILSGIVGIVMALRGYGVWALVAQLIVVIIGESITLFFIVKWVPKFQFSWIRVKRLYKYSFFVMLGYLFSVMSDYLKNFFVAKFYPVTSLSYFNKGNEYPAVLVSNINTVMGNVMMPVMSESQTEKDKILRCLRNWVNTFSIIVIPVLVMVSIMAEPIVIVLLSDKWLGAVPYFKLACLVGIFSTLENPYLIAMKATGKAGIFTSIQTVKLIVSLLVTLFTLRYGIIAVAWGGVAYSLLTVIVNVVVGRALFGYEIHLFLKDIIAASVFCSGLYFILCHTLTLNGLSLYLVQGTVCIFSYVIFVFLFKGRLIMDFIRSKVR